MQKRLYKKRHFTGFTIITLVCVLVAFWSCFHLFACDQQAEVLPDNYAGYEVALDLQINSSNAILIRLEDETVLFDKSSTTKIYPASMTKIMTAAVVLENLNDLNVSILLDEKMYSDLYQANAMTAGFLPNEEVKAIDLLYGLLLPSGAECAVGLAEYVAGSESAFVDLMNEKARELGMNSTHFINATGLHDGEHYSTVGDIASLLKYTLNNDVFYEIFTSARHSTKATILHPDGITFYSTMFSKMENTEFNGVKILGGKTGYTDEAGQCLASLSEKDGVRFILVTCGAPGNYRTQALHIDDAITVYAAVAAMD